jgi:hypothetical protein
MKNWKKIITMLSVIVIIFSIFGSIASIQSIWGKVGLIIAGVSLLTAAVLSFFIFKPVLTRNSRGKLLVTSIREVGLSDIEFRCDEDRTGKPHRNFYSQVKKEILITGTTCYRTFYEDMTAILNLLENGKRIYVLMLYPKSPDINKLQDTVPYDIIKEIDQTIIAIARQKLINNPGFKIKFLKELPKYTSIMIDSELEQIGKEPNDRFGIIRFQPLLISDNHTSGLIVQLTSNNRENMAFGRFAKDLRFLWDRKSIQDLQIIRDKELVEKE